ncbi:hypothetical protein [Paraburkholderia metrosideri]|jgi:hypothetical protein|uniref:Uncharacterized protein n=1 Tax=Paraburkholderia metrosideri TaxID=580937 RepID=A0ABN7HGX1_9BURK|nr:hypothetical protein [Paraburkholderia metrosideri]CAD6515765.1 hypothetical protein LMG28140_00653 [Paraburkholderia metrosideri]
MDATLTARLIDTLVRTARNRSVLPYSRFHALFPSNTPLTARNAILDEALRTICHEQDGDYGVLLARDNGLPGPDFFRRYRVNRRTEYTGLVGDPRYHNATMKQQRLIVTAERDRVYEHAAKHVRDRVKPAESARYAVNGF